MEYKRDAPRNKMRHDLDEPVQKLSEQGFGVNAIAKQLKVGTAWVCIAKCKDPQERELKRQQYLVKAAARNMRDAMGGKKLCDFLHERYPLVDEDQIKKLVRHQMNIKRKENDPCIDPKRLEGFKQECEDEESSVRDFVRKEMAPDYCSAMRPGQQRGEHSSRILD